MPLGFGLWLPTVAHAAGPAGPSYDLAVPTNADYGEENLSVGWTTATATGPFIFDGDTNGNGRDVASDFIVGLSFPSAPAAGCSLATLTLGISFSLSPTIKVYGWGTVTQASVQWSSSVKPSSKFAQQTTAFATNAQTGSLKTINVTAVVSEIMGGANYVPGGRINFWAEAGEPGTLIQVTAFPTDPKPRLVIYA